MRSVVFLCTGNACRSQMAEGFARQLAGDGVRVQSAGTQPRGVDARAVRAMAELGIDISQQASKGLDALDLSETPIVVTLCGDAATSCPPLPEGARHMHWPLQDPAAADGNETDVFQVFRRVRDEIQVYVAGLFAAEQSQGA